MRPSFRHHEEASGRCAINTETSAVKQPAGATPAMEPRVPSRAWQRCSFYSRHGVSRRANAGYDLPLPPETSCHEWPPKPMLKQAGNRGFVRPFISTKCDGGRQAMPPVAPKRHFMERGPGWQQRTARHRHRKQDSLCLLGPGRPPRVRAPWTHFPMGLWCRSLHGRFAPGR